MKKISVHLSLLLLFILSDSCVENKNEPSKKRSICVEHSIWRDKNKPDSCSYFSKEESCEKLIGKLLIRSRLHKHLLEKDVFEGGMSSRWFEISTDSINYFNPAGELVDYGTCHCEQGILTVHWKKGEGLPKKSEVYFNSADFVELRYFDYPYNFITFRFDTLQKPNNPTKIIGTITK